MYKTLLAAALLAFSSVALAHDIDSVQTLTQSQFRDLSTDLGAVLQPKQLMPAEPEGITGFDLGLDIGYTQLAHDKAWTQATSGHGTSGVLMTRLRVSKGLPAGIDVGGFYGTVPGSNVTAYGLELRYAIIDGSALAPAIGVRATYNKVTGVDQLSFNTKSLGIAVSKGLGPITPYIGIGHIWVSSDPVLTGTLATLQSESIGENQLFGGINLGLGFLNVVVEASRIADNVTYSAKLSIGF